MKTQETAPAQATDATSGTESEREAHLVRPRSRSPAAEVKSAAAAAADSGVALASSPSSSSSPSPFSSPLVPVAHSSRGGGIVEAPQGWGQALAAVSSKQQRERRKKR